MIDMKAMLADREAGTQGPWFVSGVRFKMNGGNWMAIHRYDETAKQDENIACVGYDPRTGIGFPDAKRIARVPDLEQALIDAVEENETAFFRGVAYAQTITPNGTLTVIDSVETVKLRRELIDARAALEAIERECSNSLGNESEIDGTQIIMLCKKGLGQ